jgi:hypothetical protein
MSKKHKSKKSSFGSFNQHLNIFAGLFFVLAFAIITTLSAYTTLAAKPAPQQLAPNLSLTPSSQRISAGSTLSVQIWANSSSQLVNAVQANLTYPLDKLNFVNIDSNNSAFGVEAEKVGGNGSVHVARGSTTPLSGKLLVATVNFTPLQSRSKSSLNINFTTDSVLLSTTTNTDVLAAKYGGSYSL